MHFYSLVLLTLFVDTIIMEISREKLVGFQACVERSLYDHEENESKNKSTHVFIDTKIAPNYAKKIRFSFHRIVLFLLG